MSPHFHDANSGSPQSTTAQRGHFVGYKEQPRGRRADRRKAAHGDELARIATRLRAALSAGHAVVHSVPLWMTVKCSALKALGRVKERLSATSSGEVTVKVTVLPSGSTESTAFMPSETSLQ